MSDEPNKLSLPDLCRADPSSESDQEEDEIEDQKADLLASIVDLFEELEKVLGKDFALVALKGVLAKAVHLLVKRS